MPTPTGIIKATYAELSPTTKARGNILVELTIRPQHVRDTNGDVVFSGGQRFPIGPDGTVSITLPANKRPAGSQTPTGIAPEAFGYVITEELAHQQPEDWRRVVVDDLTDGAVIDLADRAGTIVPVPTVQFSTTQAAWNQMVNDVAAVIVAQQQGGEAITDLYARDAAQADALATKASTAALTAGLADKASTAALADGLATKEPNLPAGGTTGTWLRGDKTWQALTKGIVGLGSVDNTSDTTKQRNMGYYRFGYTAVSDSTWHRVARMFGVTASQGAAMSVLAMGHGRNNVLNKGTTLVHIAQRGSDTIATDAWQTGAVAPNDGWRFHLVKIDSLTWDLYLQRPPFDAGGTLQVSAHYNTTLIDEATSPTAPASPLAIVPKQLDTLVGTVQPEGVVTAPVGTFYADSNRTAGAYLWQKVTGTGNTGWKVIDGDTGWRYVQSGAMVNGWTGAIMMRRTAEAVSYRLVSLNPSAATADGAYTFPAGFRPSSTSTPSSTARGLVHTAGATPTLRRFFVTTAGQLSVSGWMAVDGAYFSDASYPCDDAWPSTLPGSATAA